MIAIQVYDSVKSCDVQGQIEYETSKRFSRRAGRGTGGLGRRAARGR
jgi:hypothetical protein